MDRELLASMSTEGRQQLLRKLAEVEARARADLLTVVQSLARDEVWRHDGSRTMGEWLAGVLPVSLRTGRKLARLAGQLEDLPAVHAALAEGALGFEQVVPLGRFVTPDNQETWAVEARHATVEQLEAVARRYLARPGERAEPEGSELRYRPDQATGNVKFWGCARGEDAAVFLSAIEATAKHETARRAEPAEPAAAPAAVAGEAGGAESAPVAGDPSAVPVGDRRRWPERCGEALLRFLRGESVRRPRITLHLDTTALFGAEGGQAWLEPGTVAVSPAYVESVLAQPGRMRFVYETSDGEPVAFTDARLPHPVLADAIRRRDVHCQIGGCRSLAGEIHHVVWHSDGGKSTWGNLVLVCWRHHHEIHGGNLELGGRPRHWLVRLPTGPPPLDRITAGAAPAVRRAAA